MTRIYDLPPVLDTDPVPPNSIMPISNGIITKKITLSRMKALVNDLATHDTPGMVQVGPGLEIDGAGNLSVQNFSNYSLPVATASGLGGIKVGTSLVITTDGVLSTAYPLVPADAATFGLVKIGAGINVTGGVISINPTDYSHFPDTGYTIGTGNDLTVSIINGDTPTLSSISTLNLTVTDVAAVDQKITVSLVPLAVAGSLGGTEAAFLPDVDGVSLGTVQRPWSKVYATEIHGNITGRATEADSILVTDDSASYRYATLAPTGSTIVARTNLGHINATEFHGSLIGTASTATQSDSLKVGLSYFVASVDTNSVGTPNTIVARDSLGGINAETFNGVATHADLLKLGTLYAATSTSATANTIVARDADGNVTANHFIGISSSATYADLAEKYDADSHYDEGTVVIFGGTKEITVTNKKADHRVAGVISTKPAYLMNNESNGLPVALRGKVPVKVFGKVEKGDLLVTSSVPGFAMSVQDGVFGHAVFAKSLENKSDLDRGVIMAVIL